RPARLGYRDRRRGDSGPSAAARSARRRGCLAGRFGGRGRARPMKITGIQPLTCDSGIGGRDWLFVKVTTDEGVVGWGEGYDWQASTSLAEAIRVVGEEVIGQDPRRIDFISRRLLHSGRDGVPERMKVIAALELALYDIKGKWLNVPCYDLIGGLYRDR